MPKNRLPVDLWLNIFEYADIEDLWQLKDVNASFKRWTRNLLIRRFFAQDYRLWRLLEITAAHYSKHNPQVNMPSLFSRRLEADGYVSAVKTLIFTQDPLLVKLIYLFHHNIVETVDETMPNRPEKWTHVFEQWVDFDQQLAGIERESNLQSFRSEVGRRGSAVLSRDHVIWENSRRDQIRLLANTVARLWCILGLKRFPYSHAENRLWKEKRKETASAKLLSRTRSHTVHFAVETWESSTSRLKNGKRRTKSES